MEIPFYYSFNDFKNNFENDLKKFLNVFQDATETDYLKEVLKIYSNFIDFERYTVIEEISCNYIMEEYPEYAELDLNTYTEIMQEKLKIYCSIHGFYDNENDFPEDIEILDYWEKCNIRTKENNLLITDYRHKYYRKFYISFFDKIALDELKYKNFNFSIFRIIEFINNKIEKKEPKITQTENNNEIIEDEILADYNLQIKQKLILLNELGIIEFLNNKLLYKDNASHLAHILNAFLDTKTETLKGYVNFLLRPDNSNKNSPYNSNNRVNETLLILNQFKIKKD